MGKPAPHPGAWGSQKSPDPAFCSRRCPGAGRAEGSADWAPKLGAAPPSPLSALGQGGAAGPRGSGAGSVPVPIARSPGPALPLLDPVTWLISQSPPPTPSFHQRSWASSPSAGEGRPPPSRPRWVLADALCDVGEAFRSDSSISCWLLLSCVVAGGSGPWRPPPSGERTPKEGPWGALRDGALLGRGLPPAGGQGAAVAGPGRPHPGVPGAWFSLQGPRKQNQSTEVGPAGKFGPTGRAVQKAAQRLRRGSLAQRWEQTGA